MRKTSFTEGEFYHIYNRGVEKRNVFLDKEDYGRFMQSMEEFNTLKPIGSIYEHSFVKPKLGSFASKLPSLVSFVAFCVNPNHYHFIIRQESGRGVEKFMQRLGTGYTKYFNNKYKRSGVLFQGIFKAVHVDSNNYLLHLSAYVNLNNHVHRLGSEASKSSWGEYTQKKGGICKKTLILDQFNNTAEYKKFAEESLKDILARKKLYKELELSLLE